VAGMVYAFKVAGAAAEEGRSLDEVAAAAAKALANTRTMGIALSPCIVPQVGKPTFSIKENEIEIGMGIHGEPGIEVRPMMTADEIADAVLGRILADMPLSKGDEVSVMVNGLGATPLEELLIVYRRVFGKLKEAGVSAYMPHIGEFATSMEMAGLSVTVMKLDAELKKLLRAPGSTPFYTNSNK
jgi:dihydroxyacetone kinase-like protein